MSMIKIPMAHSVIGITSDMIVTKLTLLLALSTFQLVHCIRKESFNNGTYLVSWTVENGTITFEVEVETTGYVGFGISRNGGMNGADIVIGGVNPDATTYFTDRHGTGEVEPVIDTEANWVLLEGSEENATHTRLKFSRALNTCDNEDVAITDDTLKLIWSYGTSDTIVHHGFDNRGAKHINFLDPPMPEPDLSGLKTWTILSTDVMPSSDTSYWCTVHRGPPISSVNHVVGFNKLQPTPLAAKHTHHFIFRKCIVPGFLNARELFEGFVGAPGQDCKARPVLNYYCSTYMFVWAIGGEMTMFPDHVGFPIGEEEDEYYMFEIHYDNPEEMSGLAFDTGLQIYYTDTLRENEAGILTIGHVVYWAQVVPPNIKDFTVYGHCAAGCTETSFPEDGINVFNVLLHSHMSGRKLKLHHFNKTQELPWFAYDDNYDFNYQQNRPLKEEKKVMPGDHLTFTCTYDTNWKNGSVVIGDLGITDEMCEIFLWYYPRQRIDTCMSSYNPLQLLPDFGIQAMKSAGPGIMDPVITHPAHLNGWSYIKYLSEVFEWTPEFIEDYQRKLRNSFHLQVCASLANVTFIPRLGFTGYPYFVEQYRPENVCPAENPEPEPNSANNIVVKSWCFAVLIYSSFIVM